MSSTYGSLNDTANGLAEFHGDELGAYDLTADIRHSAALTVCDRATGTADARLLLEMTGLDQPPGRHVTVLGVPGGRAVPGSGRKRGRQR